MLNATLTIETLTVRLLPSPKGSMLSLLSGDAYDGGGKGPAAARGDLSGRCRRHSRLMGVDEEGTLAALKELRRGPADPKIKEHRGRIVKTTGDGLLVEFASVVDAVRCAVEVQHEMAERNARVPEERRIQFRIGINLGDIWTAATSTAMVLTSRRDSKLWPSLAGSASIGSSVTRCATSSTSPSRMPASNGSRT